MAEQSVFGMTSRTPVNDPGLLGTWLEGFLRSPTEAEAQLQRQMTQQQAAQLQQMQQAQQQAFQDLAATTAAAGQRTQQQQQLTDQAFQQFQGASNQPLPQLSEQAMFFPSLLSNLASVIGNNPAYRQEIQGQQQNQQAMMLQRRNDNINALKENYTRQADALRDAGNLEAEAKMREKIAKLEVTSADLRQQQGNIAETERSRLGNISAERIAAIGARTRLGESVLDLWAKSGTSQSDDDYDKFALEVYKNASDDKSKGKTQPRMIRSHLQSQFAQRKRANQDLSDWFKERIGVRKDLEGKPLFNPKNKEDMKTLLLGAAVMYPELDQEQFRAAVQQAIGGGQAVRPKGADGSEQIMPAPRETSIMAISPNAKQTPESDRLARRAFELQNKISERSRAVKGAGGREELTNLPKLRADLKQTIDRLRALGFSLPTTTLEPVEVK